jgi:hypothetical protein
LTDLSAVLFLNSYLIDIQSIYACPPHRKRSEFVGTADTIPTRFPVAQKSATPNRWHSFSRRLVNRHNTLDLASKVVCRKGARPLWIPPRKPQKSMSPLPLVTYLFDGFHATYGGIASLNLSTKHACLSSSARCSIRIMFLQKYYSL